MYSLMKKIMLDIKLVEEMKIKIFSDLHVEKGNKKLAEKLVRENTADVIVFAGDFINLGKVGDLLLSLDALATCPMIFVPGNHEYYGTRRCKVDSDLADRHYKNIVVLNERTHIIDDVCFIGATGWWDSKVTSSAYKSMNDFPLIAGIKGAMEGEWGKSAKLFFHDALSENQGLKTVCISHHAPSYRSIPDDLSHRVVNQCYANAWEDLITISQPNLWIHGHVHQRSNDYMIGRTRVVSNPYGYAYKKLNPEWREDCIVKI